MPDEKIDFGPMTDRDILIRLYEKHNSLNREITENVKVDVGKIKEYNEVQNGSIIKVITQCANNTTWIKALRWVIIILVSVGYATKGIGIW